MRTEASWLMPPAGLPGEHIGDGMVVEAAAVLEEAEYAALQSTLETVDVVGREVRRLVEGHAVSVLQPGEGD